MRADLNQSHPIAVHDLISEAEQPHASMARPRVLALALALALAGCTVGLDAGPSITDPTTTDPNTTNPPTTDPLDTNHSVDATVTHVVDADTLTVRFADGTTDTVRLLGVDAPEIHAETSPDEFEGVPDTQAGRECLRAAGGHATGVVTDALAGTDVTLTTDPAADRRGDYGRLLAYVATDDRQWNRWLVDRGHARAYERGFGRAGAFASAEVEAQRESRGLWTCRDGTPDPDRSAG